MSEKLSFKLVGTNKKDFFDNPRQENIYYASEGDPITIEADEDDNIIVTSDAGELGEVPESQADHIRFLARNEYDCSGVITSIDELSSGKRAVTVELTCTPSNRIAPGKPFHSKIKGVSFTNKHGQPRQAIISASLKPGDQLKYQRIAYEPDHPNSIAILTKDGQELGYFSSELSAKLAPFIDEGGLLDIVVSEITGLDDPEKTKGVNIKVTPLPRPVDSGVIVDMVPLGRIQVDAPQAIPALDPVLPQPVEVSRPQTIVAPPPAKPSPRPQPAPAVRASRSQAQPGLKLPAAKKKPPLHWIFGGIALLTFIIIGAFGQKVPEGLQTVLVLVLLVSAGLFISGLIKKRKPKRK